LDVLRAEKVTKPGGGIKNLPSLRALKLTLFVHLTQGRKRELAPYEIASPDYHPVSSRPPVDLTDGLELT